ncbi:dihydrofolate reductase family protein [Nocardia abscessus]|uniref:dihydrofolate reductase family protein n=1 Tax=Nocardia abscessus TaxID=120957 RepID=UPI001895596E|nr:dihydrofolate reductase family protein [Nocardia abscessus]MBF6337622.1 dihydrofolate reductase family protein [Nocardia abscessus]
MSKVVVLLNMSVDGLAGDQSWTRGFTDDGYVKFRHGQLMESRALLLGRITYEQLCRGSLARNESDTFTARVRRLPKYVASRTLRQVGDNSVLLDGDITAQIGKLRSEPGQDLLVYGSITLVEHLTTHNLVDELKLVIHPIVLGAGRRLFPTGTPTSAWRLAGTHTFDSGTVVLDYRPAPAL